MQQILPPFLSISIYSLSDSLPFTPFPLIQIYRPLILSPGIFCHLLLLPSDPGETECERREQLRQKRAEIARCWIKYSLNLLQDAKKLLEVLHGCMCLGLFVWLFSVYNLYTHVQIMPLSPKCGGSSPQLSELKETVPPTKKSWHQKYSTKDAA